MAKVLDGKTLAQNMRQAICQEVENMAVKPGLAVIVVGESPASRIYVDSKKKDCAACGVYSEEVVLSEDAGQEALLKEIEKLNKRADIHGILIQFPLPKGYNPREVVQAIDPEKDVDGFHQLNAGKLFTGDFGLLPCTPAGVMAILDHYEIPIQGKHAVVVGCSNVVGKPQALMLLHRDATVTVCHTFTEDLAFHTRQADILVAAAGKRDLIRKDMVKPGAVVIDIGINEKPGGGICGDVSYDEVAPIASYITPVPGGVGPVTRAVLMENTLKAAKAQMG